jgi:hypothetical protein
MLVACYQVFPTYVYTYSCLLSVLARVSFAHICQRHLWQSTNLRVQRSLRYFEWLDKGKPVWRFTFPTNYSSYHMQAFNLPPTGQIVLHCICSSCNDGFCVHRPVIGRRWIMNRKGCGRKRLSPNSRQHTGTFPEVLRRTTQAWCSTEIPWKVPTKHKSETLSHTPTCWMTETAKHSNCNRQQRPYGCDTSRLHHFLDNPLADGGEAVNIRGP